LLDNKKQIAKNIWSFVMNKKLTIGIGTYGKKRNYIGRTLKSIIALLKKYRYTNKTIITVYNDDK
jgi:hypothetical protein